MRIAIGICLIAVFTLSNPSVGSGQTVIIDLIKDAAKKVIRAIDLQIQRIQNKTIDLQIVQRQLENAIAKLKLQEIADWTNKQKEIYQQYFDELWKVKAAIAYYQEFSAIVKKQKQLFEEYAKARSIVTKDKNFSADEIKYMVSIYSSILQKSIDNVEDVLTIMQSFSVQMSDGDRLEMVNKTSSDIDEHLTALRSFNKRNKLLSLHRAKNKEEVEVIRQLYGIQ